MPSRTPSISGMPACLLACLLAIVEDGLSLCDREKAVDFQQLCMEPGLVFRPELVVRYHETLYPGRVALPLIMSYLTFGKALNDEALLKLAQTEDPRLEDIAVQHISKAKISRKTLR